MSKPKPRPVSQFEMEEQSDSIATIVRQPMPSSSFSLPPYIVPDDHGHSSHHHHQPPPPYFQHQEELFSHPVESGGSDTLRTVTAQVNLISEILQNVTCFTIQKSSQTTRYAMDNTNRQLFSYTEQVLASNEYGNFASIFFNDNNGREFLRADIDLSAGIRILSGSIQLGVLDKMTSCIGMTGIHGTSTIGLGSVSFEANGCFSCLYSLLTLGCCGPLPQRYQIKVNGAIAGDFDSKKGKLNLLNNMDPRLKGVIIVAAFMLFNVHYNRKCCSCCC